MKKKLIWVTISLLILLSVVLMSCSSTTSSTTPQQTSVTSPPPASTPSSTAVTTAPPPSTTASQANWWDKFGTPQYGGTITYATGGLMGTSWDTYNFIGAENDLWYEALFTPSWIVDRNTWSMTGTFVPDQYWAGNLAQSWDWTDPTTLTVQLRQGVHWQDKAPVNGREFVATDVQAHYDRLMGTGSGYTQGDPMYGGMLGPIKKVTAADKYTVVFTFTQPSAQNFQTIADNFAMNEFEAPEWVALGGPPASAAPATSTTTAAPGGPPQPPPPPTGAIADWHNVVGTGAWMLTNFVSGGSFTFSKNPNYWGHDPRYSQNQLPYADTLTMLVIPDSSTRLAALRTGQVATLNSGAMGVTWQDEGQLVKSNPDIQSVKVPAGASGVGLRVDHKPFTDIRVREALDMAIDRDAIAKSFYGGTTDSTPVGMITPAYTGYAYAYADWPQSLKDQYTYNPTAAKKLLADAGYASGFNTDVVTTNDPTQVQLLQIFQSYFKDIGVNMTINTMDSATEQAYTRGGKHDQMSSQGFGSTFPPTRILDEYYSTGGTDAIYYGLNNAPDTKYDTLHDQFLGATDPTQAMQIFQQMDKEIIEQHIVIAGPQYYNYTVWQPWLEGYSGEATMWGQGLVFSRLWTTKK